MHRHALVLVFAVSLGSGDMAEKIRFVDAMAEAIKRVEGYYVTALEAEARKIPWPTVAQRLKNPGNVRDWKGYVGGKLVRYPRKKILDGFYVDFSDPLFENMPNEGDRVLRVLIQQYIDGKYTKGRSPSLLGMFATYAPSGDGNKPVEYAKQVAKKIGISVDCPLNLAQRDWDANSSN
jgi:hypothetical protein